MMIDNEIYNKELSKFNKSTFLTRTYRLNVIAVLSFYHHFVYGNSFN